MLVYPHMQTLWSDKDWQVILEPARLLDGRTKEVVRLKRPDSVHILAFPTKESILLLREFRPYYGTYIWMIPSGKVDKERNIDEAAQRELREETGYRAESLVPYCTTNYSESIIATNYIYIGRNLRKDPLPQDDDEMIELHEMPIEEALEHVLHSKFVHTASAFAILRYLRENR